jgi:hypothetical protein
MITAKVVVQSRTESGVGDQRQVAVNLTADYNDGRNREWSLYTPSLSLSMTLKGDVADQFPTGKAFTLQFVPEDDNA